MIIDPSAALAIIFGEPGFEVFARVIASAPVRRMSAASFVELSIVAESRGGDRGLRQCDSFLRDAGVLIEPLTEEQGFLARQGYSDFGRGRHAAGLNLGDCFSYALAKATGEPLLFKGEDFRVTDIQSALP